MNIVTTAKIISSLKGHSQAFTKGVSEGGVPTALVLSKALPLKNICLSKAAEKQL
jgi:hypothetical protein